MKWIGREELACSIDFIERVLTPFSQNLLFIPSRAPQHVTINVHVESDTIKQPWGAEDVERITSIKHDTTELLDYEALPADFGTLGIISIESLYSIISEILCIPRGYLKIITNKPKCKNSLYLSVDLKHLQNLY